MGGSGSISALSHYQNLVDDMFGGDYTKVIFGFCISDCSGTGSNANAMQASDVMKSLRNYYPCNGGAFFGWLNMILVEVGLRLLVRKYFPTQDAQALVQDLLWPLPFQILLSLLPLPHQVQVQL